MPRGAGASCASGGPSRPNVSYLGSTSPSSEAVAQAAARVRKGDSCVHADGTHTIIRTATAGVQPPVRLGRCALNAIPRQFWYPAERLPLLHDPPPDPEVHFQPGKRVIV